MTETMTNMFPITAATIILINISPFNVSRATWNNNKTHTLYFTLHFISYTHVTSHQHEHVLNVYTLPSIPFKFSEISITSHIQPPSTIISFVKTRRFITRYMSNQYMHTLVVLIWIYIHWSLYRASCTATELLTSGQTTEK